MLASYKRRLSVDPCILFCRVAFSRTNGLHYLVAERVIEFSDPDILSSFHRVRLR